VTPCYGAEGRSKRTSPRGHEHQHKSRSASAQARRGRIGRNSLINRYAPPQSDTDLQLGLDRRAETTTPSASYASRNDVAAQSREDLRKLRLCRASPHPQ
jgi:hypothetical protein